MNVSRHNPNLAFSGRNHARTVRPNQARFASLQEGRRADHIASWDAFGNADNQRNAGLGRFHDCVGGERRRNKNHRRVGVSVFHRFSDRVEYGQPEVRLPAFSRSHSPDHFRAVVHRCLGMKTRFAPGESLNQDARVLIHQYAHAAAAPLAARTTFSAASRMPSATVKLNPEFFRISCPFSTLVPSIRTTIGTWIFNSRAAFTTPVASTSPRRMPPKILISTAFTPESESRMRNAFLICSAFAPPPTSRKFAGLPPANFTISMVAIARPAPFTMHAMLPSSLM